MKTIIVPKNLKGLKDALPGSKYEHQNKPEAEGKFRRANSANNLRNDIPQVINSPKMGQQQQELYKYAFMRRQSQEQKQELHSERQEGRGVPRM